MISMPDSTMPRGGLGQLLRSRRERLSPQAVGLIPGSRRRTPGLRREEVALLANVSNTYYTFLEQGRATRPSPEVLGALAEALRLDALDRRHLHALALETGREIEPEPETLDDAVRALVERLHPDPTYVKGRSWDILAANRAARALFEDWGVVDGTAPNMLRWMFTDPAARRVYVEWEDEARAMLARFHAAVVARPHEPTTSAVIDEVLGSSPLARRWWDDHDVAPIAAGTKSLRHPILGVFRLRHAVLHVGGQPDQHLVTFTGSGPDDAAHFEALAALAPPDRRPAIATAGTIGWDHHAPEPATAVSRPPSASTLDGA